MPPSGSGAVLCLVLLEVDNNNNKSSVGTNLYPLTTNLYPLTTNLYPVKHYPEINMNKSLQKDFI